VPELKKLNLSSRRLYKPQAKISSCGCEKVLGRRRHLAWMRRSPRGLWPPKNTTLVYNPGGEEGSQWFLVPGEDDISQLAWRGGPGVSALVPGEDDICR